MVVLGLVPRPVYFKPGSLGLQFMCFTQWVGSGCWEPYIEKEPCPGLVGESMIRGNGRKWQLKWKTFAFCVLDHGVYMPFLWMLCRVEESFIYNNFLWKSSFNFVTLRKNIHASNFTIAKKQYNEILCVRKALIFQGNAKPQKWELSLPEEGCM